jgi:hypothetical protein
VVAVREDMGDAIGIPDHSGGRLESLHVPGASGG